MKTITILTATILFALMACIVLITTYAPYDMQLTAIVVSCLVFLGLGIQAILICVYAKENKVYESCLKSLNKSIKTTNKIIASC